MNNKKSQTSQTLTQSTDHSFSWKTCELGSISIEIPKLKPEESKLVDEIFDEWLDRTIEILLSDISEENKGSKIYEVTNSLALKITNSLHRVHFMILVKERFN